MPGVRKEVSRTETAVNRQIVAMGCDWYEIGVLDRKTGRMVNRVMERGKIAGSVAYWRAKNTQNHDIYIRPDFGALESVLWPAVVLLDDISQPVIEKMVADGLKPCAILETSPGNLQAWVRLGMDPVPKVHLTAIAQALARRYGGDLNSAAFRHYGRLAGFTNRKQKHRRQGMHPFVLVRGAWGGMARAGTDWLNWAVEYGDRDKARDYARNRQNEEKKRSLDPSRIDFMATLTMIEQGWPDSEIMAVLRVSPGLQERKKGHVEDYLRRTIEAARRQKRMVPE